jgi:hypothetical protein
MLKFITSMELLYKSGVIVGLFVAFAIVPNGNSIIIGQIVALVLFIPLEYYFINRKVLFDHPIKESVITILPSLLVSLSIIFNDWYFNVFFFIIAALVFKLYFLNPKRFQFKLLLE